MSYRLPVSIMKEGRWYVARALELGVVSQGRTISDATKNLQEAVELYLQDRPRFRSAVSVEPPLFTTIEV